MKSGSCVTREKSEQALRTKSVKQDVMAAAESHTGTHSPIHSAGKVVHVVAGFQKWPAKYRESPTEKRVCHCLPLELPSQKCFSQLKLALVFQAGADNTQECTQELGYRIQLH